MYHPLVLIKDVVSCSGPFWRLISRFFFITKYNTIVSIFLHVSIGIIKYKKEKFFTIFNTILYWFLSQSRHLQIEVGGWCGWFRHLESSKTNLSIYYNFEICLKKIDFLKPEQETTSLKQLTVTRFNYSNLSRTIHFLTKSQVQSWKSNKDIKFCIFFTHFCQMKNYDYQ